MSCFTYHRIGGRWGLVSMKPYYLIHYFNTIPATIDHRFINPRYGIARRLITAVLMSVSDSALCPCPILVSKDSGVTTKQCTCIRPLFANKSSKQLTAILAS